MKFHRPVIEDFPLQIYAGILIFSPKNSLVRQLFHFEEPDYLVTKPTVDDEWPYFLFDFRHHGLIGGMASCRGPDDTLVASASTDGTITIWESTHGECLQSIKLLRRFDWGEQALLALPQYIEANRVICAVKATVDIWDLSTGVHEGTLTDPKGSDIIALSFLNGSTTQCVTLTELGEATIWDLESRKAIRTLTLWQEGVRILGYGRIVYAKFAYHGHGKTRLLTRHRTIGDWFCAGPPWFSTSRPMTVWELETETCLRAIPDEGRLAGATGFSHDGEFIAEATIIKDRCINIWDVATGKLHRRINEHVLTWCIEFSRDSKQVFFLTGSDGWNSTRVSVWDLEGGRCLQIIDILATALSLVQVVSDAMHVAVSYGSTISILETSSESCKVPGEGLAPDISGIYLSENERYALYLGDSLDIQVSDLDTGRVVYKGEPIEGRKLLDRWERMGGDCFSHLVRQTAAGKRLPGLSDLPSRSRHTYNYVAGWIRRDREELIRVPSPYAPKISDARGSTIVVQRRCGSIYHLRFRDS